MRASRLINILTTLQARGLVTAEALAEENDVSVRTIYRDIDALSLSGVPVYSERGSDGGYRLLDGYRVRLNGLSAGEAEAMFLSALPGAAAALGLETLMAAAQTKLAAALPEDMRAHARRLQSKFHLDAPGWFGQGEEPAHLQAIADAVWNSRRIRMRYRTWRAERDREVEPVGLVLKSGAWYMVARVGQDMRTYRISRVLDLIVTDQKFEWPETFDLAAYWNQSTARLESELYRDTAVLRLSPSGLEMLWHNSPAFARERFSCLGVPDLDGWQVVELPVPPAQGAVSEILRLAGEVEVLEPESLRQAMHTAITTIALRYADAGESGVTRRDPPAPAHGNESCPAPPEASEA